MRPRKTAPLKQNALETPLSYRGRPLKEDEAVIALGRGCYSLVNLCDLRRAAAVKWGIGAKRYAHNRWRGLYLHHFILGKPPEGMEIDHCNGDTFDNRRENLRFVTHAKNLANTVRAVRPHAYRGVKPASNGRWAARYSGVHLATHDTAREAALARDQYVRGRVGDLGTYNFPFVGERSALTRKIRTE